MIKSWAIARVVITELYRRKDFYVLFVLTALITLVAGSMSFFHDQGIARYLKEICLLLIWVSGLVIAIITAARQIPAEREQRTILPLLAKPVTRAHLVAGKFLGCWVATGLALAFFYLFFTVLAGVREHSWPMVAYFQAVWMQWVMLGIVIAFSVLGSIIFAAPSSNSTITFVLALAILFVGRHLNTVALGLPEPASSIVYAIYYAIPHLEFFDLRDQIIHDWGAIPWWAFGVATLYSAAYSSFFLLAAWLAFRRKPLT
jgi:ABC-type transport system involved in multi-copper enzyme maturation permease subunit